MTWRLGQHSVRHLVVGEMVSGVARFHLAQKNGWVPWHFGLSAMAAFRRQSGSVTGSLGWTNGTMIVLRGLVWAR
jgi:hypothetical protein